MRLNSKIMVRILVLGLILSGCATAGGSSKVPIYLVKMERGDTLSSVATKFDTTWKKIAELNGLKPGQALKVGAIVRVRPGPGGIVASAESLPQRVQGGKNGKSKRQVSRLAPGPNPTGDAARADEFTDDDVPHDDDGIEAPSQKRSGLLFGGDGEDRASLHWPVRGELSSVYGRRGRRMHKGIDVRAPRGTEVRSAGTGTVEFVGRKNGYGKTVIVLHRGVRTLYAHLNSLDVEVGDKVTHTTVIGEVGSTGNARGTHLHFEIRTLDDATIDPLTVLEKEALLSVVH